MTITPITQPRIDPELTTAKIAFMALASTHGAGIETLFGAWSRWRQASARSADDVLAGVHFADVVDAVLAARIGAIPFGLPQPAKPTTSRR